MRHIQLTDLKMAFLNLMSAKKNTVDCTNHELIMQSRISKSPR